MKKKEKKIRIRRIMYLWIFIVILICVVCIIFIQPLIVLYISWKKTNFSENYLSQNLQYSVGMTGFEGLPDFRKGDQLIGQAITPEICSNGYFLGERELTNVNCTNLCNSNSNLYFSYKFITKNSIIINEKYLRAGSWCLPTSLALCNLNVSLAIKSIGKYECVSKYPQIFGGLYGNEIIGCAPMYELNDNLKKITYTNNIPSTMVINDIDEKIPGTDTFRFSCNTFDNSNKNHGNNNHFQTFLMRPDLGNRFQLFYDSCSFFDPGGKLVNNKCECSHEKRKNIIKPGLENSSHTKEVLCSVCTSGYEIIDEKLPQFGSKYGVSIGINCVDPVYIDYVKSMPVYSNGVFPCGLKTLLSIREDEKSEKYGCHRALLNITNTYTPEMLEIING